MQVQATGPLEAAQQSALDVLGQVFSLQAGAASGAGNADLGMSHMDSVSPWGPSHRGRGRGRGRVPAGKSFKCFFTCSACLHCHNMTFLCQRAPAGKSLLASAHSKS